MTFYGITGQRLARYRCKYDEIEPGVYRFGVSLIDRTQHIGGQLTTETGKGVTTDRLGSVRARDGERYTYFPYGEPRTATVSDSGMYAGLESPVRKYDAGNGRFSTPDPLGLGAVKMGDPGSWNRFAYVQGDPVNYNDPLGLASCSVSGTSTFYPDDWTKSPVTTATITCTSFAGTIQATDVVPFVGWEATAKNAEKTLGAQIDLAERWAFDGLLAAAIKRVQGYLSDLDCAKNFSDPAAASAKAGKIGFSDQGKLQYTMRDGIATPTRRSPGVARYNRFTGSINLNSTVNWIDPGATFVSLDGGNFRVDLLTAQAGALGVSSVTAEQYMDLTILHELSHYKGAIGNPDTNPRVEIALWNDCIK
jgi:RHS repeat-associated protein